MEIKLLAPIDPDNLRREKLRMTLFIKPLPWEKGQTCSNLLLTLLTESPNLFILLSSTFQLSNVRTASIKAYQIATIFSRNDSHYDNFEFPINSKKITEIESSDND
jgi:hypothetical protein